MPVTQDYIESLIKQNQLLIEQVDSLSKTIDELNATIKELREQCGCFRNETGAKEYINLMSFISTARKNGFDSYHAIEMALSGQFNQIFVWGY